MLERRYVPLEETSDAQNDRQRLYRRLSVNRKISLDWSNFVTNLEMKRHTLAEDSNTCVVEIMDEI